MSADVIEGTAVEVVEERPVEQSIVGAGTAALATMTDQEFDRRLAALVKGRERIVLIQRSLMVSDVDYGVIPGTDKPSLLKPGAEKLCDFYRFAASFTPERTIGDGVTAPHLSYLTRCDLHLGSLDGSIVAVAFGAANSWEKRYRYRNAERTCPNCGKPTVIKGKAEYGGGWLCWPKKGGCNSKWRDGDKAIEGQEAGQVDNPDPFDLDVVLAAMAEKRAHVHATLRACAASALFTADIEDLPEFKSETPAKPAETSDEGLVGEARTQGNQDYELRQGPDGPTLPFRVVDGKQAQIVMAHGDLADVLSTMRDDVLGKRVTVWGSFSDESFEKKKDGKWTTIAYSVLHLTRIKTPDFVLPAPGVAPEADSLPLFDPAESARLDAEEALA